MNISPVLHIPCKADVYKGKEDFSHVFNQKEIEEFMNRKPISDVVTEPLHKINTAVELLKSDNYVNPANIFENKNVPQETKDYLADKPVTAVRYQRLFEKSPGKAEIFIGQIKAGNDPDHKDLELKYEGKSYTEVLDHINALLEMNSVDSLKLPSRGVHNYYQRLFIQDDEMVNEPSSYEFNSETIKLYKPIGFNDTGFYEQEKVDEKNKLGVETPNPKTDFVEQIFLEGAYYMAYMMLC